MTLLITLLTIIILLIVLLFTVASKINFNFDSTRSDMHLTLRWLNPLLKSVIVREDDGFVLTAYLLNKRILTKHIKQGENVSRNGGIFRNLNPTDVHIDTRYGFRDPFVTGLACSAITMASELLNVESLQLRPDFLAVNDYVNLDATARLNLGSSLMKLI